MADWAVTLPPETAAVGDPDHVNHHNAIVKGIKEARNFLDTLEAAVTDKADGGHKHSAADITSGTLAEARVPDLAIAKVTGLKSALDGKQESGSYATTAQLNAKADASALSALEARVEALETPEA